MHETLNLKLLYRCAMNDTFSLQGKQKKPVVTHKSQAFWSVFDQVPFFSLCMCGGNPASQLVLRVFS